MSSAPSKSSDVDNGGGGPSRIEREGGGGRDGGSVDTNIASNGNDNAATRTYNFPRVGIGHTWNFNTK